MYGRLAVCAGRGQAIAAIAVPGGVIVGTEILQLRHIATWLGLALDLDAALEALAQGNSAIAIIRLAQLDGRLASLPGAGSGASPCSPGAREYPCHHGGAHRACLLLRRRSARVRFTEIDLFGVYVAPMSLMMVAAWFVTIALRRVCGPFGLLRYVWHPALFVFAVYTIGFLYAKVRNAT